MYKTADRARWYPSMPWTLIIGNREKHYPANSTGSDVESLGRKYCQVKTHRHRIVLGEIE